MFERTIRPIIAIILLGPQCVLAQTMTSGGYVDPPAILPIGLPSVGITGVSATHDSLAGAFGFNQNTKGIVPITTFGGTRTTAAAILDMGPTNIFQDWTIFQRHTTGPTLNLGMSDFSPNLQATSSLAGRSTIRTSGGVVNRNDIGIDFIDAESNLSNTQTLSSGLASHVTRLTSQGFIHSMEIDTSRSVIFTPTATTSHMGTSDGGAINFRTIWTGRSMSDNSNLVHWQTNMASNSMLINGVQITTVSSPTIVQVYDAGFVGSRNMIMPEPMSMAGIVIVVIGGAIIWRTKLRLVAERNQPAILSPTM